MTLELLASAAADVAGHTSTTEAVLFWVLGTVAVAGAIGVVVAPKAVYSAMFLANTMIVLAVFYIAQDALFLGVVQIVVYTGAVMMLFLFVLMLVGVDTSEALVETIRGQRVSAIAVGVGFGVLLIAGIGSVSVGGFVGLEQANAGGNVQGLAALIFTEYLWAFELTGALLITAALGAMVLAHRERFERRKTQRELAHERFQPGGGVDGVVAGVDPRVGQRGGSRSGLEAFDDQLALGLSPLETLPVGQHHRPQRCGDQQRAGQLERPQIPGEDQHR
ncbi:MAG: NADH-quinone oxidoreductase subunit J [Mycobacterium sp.]